MDRSQPGTSARVTLVGEYDVHNAVDLRQQVIAALAAGHRPVLLDTSAVTFLDSTALGAMIGGRNVCLAAGTELRIVDASPAVRKILDITGTGDLFGVDDR